MNRPAATQHGLVWCGPVFDPSGYADEARGMLCALEASGVPVALRPLNRYVAGFREGLPRAERNALERQIARSLPKRQVLVQHHTADGFCHVEGDVCHVGRTMFETDSIPPSWVRHCNQMDELWLPSQFNIDTFRRAGVHVPITRVPGGVDSTVYHPGVAPMSVAGLRGTVFLAVFEWRLRKGWDVLLRAWAEAFTPDDDVTLVLRTYPIDKVAGEDNETVINAQIDAYLEHECGRSRRQVAPIVVLGKTIPAAAMPSLYRIASALVAPTRGEGWGRPFMEAMASGVPVIATRWSAHLEFMNDGNSLLIDIDGTESADGVEIPIYSEQQWASPNVAHLSELMQRVHAQPAEASTLGARARDEMVSLWPWSRAALAISTRLEEIRESSASAFTPPAALLPLGAGPTIPKLRVDGRLFDAKSGESSADRIVGHLAANWPSSTLVCSRAVAMRRPALSSPAMHAYRALLAAESQSTAPGSTADRTPHAPPDDLVLTLLDGASATPVARPRCSRWTIYTNDAVVNEVPHALVRALRDDADDVWVPTNSALDACLRVGVDRERLWLVPPVGAPRNITPDGPRQPLKHRADVVFLLPAIDVVQSAAVELLLKTWQRAFSAKYSALLLVYAPETENAAVNAWHQQLFATLSSGRLLLGAPIQVLREQLPSEDLAALIRAVDVVMDPEATPSTMSIATLAGTLERAVMSAGDSSWRDRLRAMADPQERARHVADARCHIQTMATEEQMAHAAAERLSECARTNAPRHASLVAWDASPFVLHDARSTTILALVDWHDGTGIGTVQSYLRNFTANDDVSLALCLDPAQGLTIDDVATIVNNASHAVGHDDETMADILLIPDVLTDDVRRSLLARCEAVVSVHDAVLATAAQLSGRRVITTLSPDAWHAVAGTQLVNA